MRVCVRERVTSVRDADRTVIVIGGGDCDGDS